MGKDEARDVLTGATVLGGSSILTGVGAAVGAGACIGEGVGFILLGIFGCISAPTPDPNSNAVGHSPPVTIPPVSGPGPAVIGMNVTLPPLADWLRFLRDESTALNRLLHALQQGNQDNIALQRAAFIVGNSSASSKRAEYVDKLNALSGVIGSDPFATVSGTLAQALAHRNEVVATSTFHPKEEQTFVEVGVSPEERAAALTQVGLVTGCWLPPDFDGEDIFALIAGAMSNMETEPPAWAWG